ncbi:MAG: hypothetical protein J6T74_06770 [Clostridia bacterium]|nr:hypothetical protein [Clostridia bacterium]
MFGEYDYEFNPGKTDELCSMLKYYLNHNMAHIEDLEREVNALREHNIALEDRLYVMEQTIKDLDKYLKVARKVKDICKDFPDLEKEIDDVHK